jgi:hypothetical protein
MESYKKPNLKEIQKIAKATKNQDLANDVKKRIKNEIKK